MRPLVYFKHKQSGEMESLYVGFNFSLFFLSFALFGLLLYLRGLTKWGIISTLSWIGIFIPGLNILIGGFIIGASIYLGIKGNELTAKHLLKKGYEFMNPDSELVKRTKMLWNIKE